VVRELHTSNWEYPTGQNHMICTLKFWKNIALSMIVMGGMSILAGPAQARTFSSRGDIFSAQKRLRAKGYYRGPINGRYNSRTVRALTNFQFDHNLAQTGRLNPKTCKMLGASCAIPRMKS
jgi:peptidoglycan hydrolase-like protein with peptidoglycan-binding domain